MGENSGSTKHPPLNEAVALNEAIALIRSLGIKKLRVSYTDHNLLKALVNTNVEVNLGIPNEDLHDLALSYEHVCRWVCNNIKPYLSSLKIRYINVGNEVFKGEEQLWYLVLPAMQNVHKALNSLDKGGFSIHVSTSVDMDVLNKWTKPTHASILNDWTSFIQPIVKFLVENKSPLMVNLFSYKKSYDTAFSCSCHFTKAFEEAVEAIYRTVERISHSSVPNGSSTGFPSTGGEPNVTTRANTFAYNQCLVTHNSYKRYFSELPIHLYFSTALISRRYQGDQLEWAIPY